MSKRREPSGKVDYFIADETNRKGKTMKYAGWAINVLGDYEEHEFETEFDATEWANAVYDPDNGTAKTGILIDPTNLDDWEYCLLGENSITLNDSGAFIPLNLDSSDTEAIEFESSMMPTFVVYCEQTGNSTENMRFSKPWEADELVEELNNNWMGYTYFIREEF